jgi:hypothetical protein
MMLAALMICHIYSGTLIFNDLLYADLYAQYQEEKSYLNTMRLVTQHRGSFQNERLGRDVLMRTLPHTKIALVVGEQRFIVKQDLKNCSPTK